MKNQFKIEPFVLLGDKLSSGLPVALKERACAENLWFTPSDIDFALEVIRETLLEKKALEAWLAGYSAPEAEAFGKDVMVVMAGNIPFAGFYDMLCALVCGHRCFVKTSSKDAVLMDFMIDRLLEIDPQLPIYKADQNAKYDVLIFSGSDAAAEIYLEAQPSAKMLMRTSRFSVAVLEGDESDSQIESLSSDVFRYFSLGCRNVSMVFVPRDFDVATLKTLSSSALQEHKGFKNNYRAARALRFMEAKEFIDTEDFILREGSAPSNYIAELIYYRYDSLEQVGQWLEQNQDKIQCVVSSLDIHERVCGFGQAQRPRATDFADGVDVIEFLYGTKK